eukprot:CAMPEP_0202905718 /NCGR_PEP_ID=MMETSP1392-20130828/35695_1 /ASSEMBLY_ACC=CAM_ASM_000868 /TAXON_ID=225041 /ORGANISM="Chlamydomonas chlamydogama, Strain SAG 11-48b" /LENGTH=135 /DNA_ID=CAMNT_0049593941 /DNA_START=110 /DNA_END=513 /DNA_ORIENTATION=-
MGEALVSNVYIELQQAVYDLSSRGLLQAARWASEQLVGLDDAAQQHGHASSAAKLVRDSSSDNHPHFLLAKSHFDFKDYRRAAFVLQSVPGNKATFLRLYSTYLAGEQRKEDARIEAAGPLGVRAGGGNPDLEAL